MPRCVPIARAGALLVYGAGRISARFQMKVQLGNFLPDDESTHARNFVVLDKSSGRSCSAM